MVNGMKNDSGIGLQLHLLKWTSSRHGRNGAPPAFPNNQTPVQGSIPVSAKKQPGQWVVPAQPPSATKGKSGNSQMVRGHSAFIVCLLLIRERMDENIRRVWFLNPLIILESELLGPNTFHINELVNMDSAAAWVLG